MDRARPGSGGNAALCKSWRKPGPPGLTGRGAGGASWVIGSITRFLPWRFPAGFPLSSSRCCSPSLLRFRPPWSGRRSSIRSVRCSARAGMPTTIPFRENVRPSSSSQWTGSRTTRRCARECWGARIQCLRPRHLRIGGSARSAGLGQGIGQIQGEPRPLPQAPRGGSPGPPRPSPDDPDRIAAIGYCFGGKESSSSRAPGEDRRDRQLPRRTRHADAGRCEEHHLRDPRPSRGGRSFVPPAEVEAFHREMKNAGGGLRVRRLSGRGARLPRRWRVTIPRRAPPTRPRPTRSRGRR